MNWNGIGSISTKLTNKGKIIQILQFQSDKRFTWVKKPPRYKSSCFWPFIHVNKILQAALVCSVSFNMKGQFTPHFSNRQAATLDTLLAQPHPQLPAETLALGEDSSSVSIQSAKKVNPHPTIPRQNSRRCNPQQNIVGDLEGHTLVPFYQSRRDLHICSWNRNQLLFH